MPNGGIINKYDDKYKSKIKSLLRIILLKNMSKVYHFITKYG